MKLGLLVVLAVAVLVPRLSEGRIVSKLELKEKLGKAIILPKKLQGMKDKILAKVVSEVNRISRMNTSLVKLYGKRRTTTTATPTTVVTTPSSPTIEPTTEPTTTEPTTTETTTEPTTTSLENGNDRAKVDTASKESELTERDRNLRELVKKVSQDDKSMDEESDWGLESDENDESDEGGVMQNDDMRGYEDEESDEDGLPLDNNSMDNENRRQDGAMIDEEDEESDEDGLPLDNNSMDNENRRQDGAMIDEEDEESDEGGLALDDNSMDNEDRKQDGTIIDEEEEESDEGGLALDDNMTVDADEDSREDEMKLDDNMLGDEDEESNEEDSKMEDEEEEAEEYWRRKKRFIPLRWPKRKMRARSGGRYGLFQLSDNIFCDSGYGETKNKCNTDCSAFTDDDITDDIDCIVKTGNWRRFYKKSSRRY